MSSSVAGDPPVTVVALDGELDASNYEQVIDVVRNAYADGARGLVFDLCELDVHGQLGPVRAALRGADHARRDAARPRGGWGALHEMSSDHDAAGRATSASPAPRTRSRGSSSGPA